ncbi:hypothetical protein PAAG_00663 [Paracoccidioides lutzii Pb01]|uniref:Uncharacterized protein n=1 Tax=Paracoccidioides lutzii (strain ATCC MYA-826 / Pb01) TaxID=502779 RepID=C1GQ68_PARBA|nr:hypothetical protein PAAG_00663 [Paracoccidioides lutzii Pb01]EEH37742.2 hypothetical protein PAAG_00663 [Paracoccidioides lutzii Pb01]
MYVYEIVSSLKITTRILRREEIAQIFDKVVLRALKVVYEQVKKATEKNNNPVKLIILCGVMVDIVYGSRTLWSQTDNDPDLDSDGNQYNFPANRMCVTGCIQWFIRRDDSVEEKAKWTHEYITLKRTGSATETAGGLLLYCSKNLTPRQRQVQFNLMIRLHEKRSTNSHNQGSMKRQWESETRPGPKRVGFTEAEYRGGES